MTLVPPSYAPACPSGSTLDILQSGCVPAGITDFSTTYLDVYMPTDNPIVELSVYYACQHTYDGDLKFTLLTPWGGSVLLTNKRGAGGDNYNGTVFSTTCATSVTAGAAPFANCYKPEESLSTLSGNSTFGRWSLKVEDVQASDVGYSTAFAVLFCT